MFDLIIQNGLIVDGSRRKPFRGYLCVKDGKIAAVAEGAPREEEASEVIDAEGHVVAPGFIDLHCHSDKTWVVCPSYESVLTEGVTFELGGQCGLSCIPVSEHNRKSQAALGGLLAGEYDEIPDPPAGMAEYAEAVSRRGISINVGMSIGHGALRSALIGWEQRPLTDRELAELCELLDRELKAGAMGVSFGLIYPPGSFCDTAEIRALARICAANDRFLSVHLRNENRFVFEALDEMLGVAADTGVRLEISHLKLMGKTMWGRADELLARIDLARARGIAVHCDQYPYDASHSRLTSSFPREAMDGGYEALAENLKDDAFWDRISEHGTLPELEFRGGAANVTVNEIPSGVDYPEIIGKTLPEIAALLGTDVPDAVRQILIRCRGNISCIYHNMSMEDVLQIMSQRDISVVSDGTAYDPQHYIGKPHPRNTGTFPRFLRLAREKKLMPVEDAVYKMTGLPSTVMGMDSRFGFLKEGLDATVTVFDWEKVTDRASYEEPALPSEGIDYVFVSGVRVLDHGKITAARPGRCILR